MHKLESGMVFHRLTALTEDPRSQVAHPRWLFQCACGVIVSIRTTKVVRGLTQSCGCLRAENNLKHGGVGTPEYKTWCGIRKRCLQSNSAQFSNYGGRGIVMSQEWQTSFATFLEDMGPRPEGFSIERIDNNGPYSKENCRWATMRAQAANKRNSRKLTLNGETHNLAYWSRKTGLPRLCIYQRIKTLGWSDEKALTTPNQSGDHSIRQQAKHHDLKRQTVSARLKKGWSLERALNTPVK